MFLSRVPNPNVSAAFETVVRKLAAETSGINCRWLDNSGQSPRTLEPQKTRRTVPFFAAKGAETVHLEYEWRSDLESNRRERFDRPPKSSESLFARQKSSASMTLVLERLLWVESPVVRALVLARRPVGRGGRGRLFFELQTILGEHVFNVRIEL